jgi:anti-sigma B factor antagonist
MSDEAAVSFLTLEIDGAGHTVIVHCHGKLVTGVTDVLSIKVKQLIPDTKRIVLDLKDLGSARSGRRLLVLYHP